LTFGDVGGIRWDFEGRLIRDGLITPETASDLLPKNFLKLEALKEKYRKLG
jgi:hypothetical protein